MHDALLRGVELAVPHAGSGAHALHVTRADGRTIADGVLVRELAIEHVADDLHVAMAVSAESLAGRDTILVEHAQGAERDMLLVDVIGEGKTVIRVEPAVIGVAALSAAPGDFHAPC